MIHGCERSDSSYRAFVRKRKEVTRTSNKRQRNHESSMSHSRSADTMSSIRLESVLESSLALDSEVQTHGAGPKGLLPLTPEMLLTEPSGNLFGLTQNAGMGWEPSRLLDPEFLILSTHGGLRGEDGKPIALGFHSGHWEVGLLVAEAAREFKELRAVPFAGACTDPCDGRTQGTTGMMDSLPFRNDAAMVLRRLMRSLPPRKGVRVWRPVIKVFPQ